ncbi:MAG: hypothetical protein KJ069_26775 [Anaerolineae bacterium]|nr:hypothetical protein [Anaerolineae bacterium]
MMNHLEYAGNETTIDEPLNLAEWAGTLADYARPWKLLTPSPHAPLPNQ